MWPRNEMGNYNNYNIFYSFPTYNRDLGVRRAITNNTPQYNRNSMDTSSNSRGNYISNRGASEHARRQQERVSQQHREEQRHQQAAKEQAAVDAKKAKERELRAKKVAFNKLKTETKALGVFKSICKQDRQLAIIDLIRDKVPGFKPEEKDQYGQTIIDLALYYRQEELAAFLLRKNVDITTPRFNGRDAMWYANHATDPKVKARLTKMIRDKCALDLARNPVPANSQRAITTSTTTRNVSINRPVSLINTTKQPNIRAYGGLPNFYTMVITPSIIASIGGESAIQNLVVTDASGVSFRVAETNIAVREGAGLFRIFHYTNSDNYTIFFSPREPGNTSSCKLALPTAVNQTVVRRAPSSSNSPNNNSCSLNRSTIILTTLNSTTQKLTNSTITNFGAPNSAAVVVAAGEGIVTGHQVARREQQLCVQSQSSDQIIRENALREIAQIQSVTLETPNIANISLLPRREELTPQFCSLTAARDRIQESTLDKAITGGIVGVLVGNLAGAGSGFATGAALGLGAGLIREGVIQYQCSKLGM